MKPIRADVATRHVVDRCPSCGVKHEVRARACEACDTPLHAWCRVHGRETGWLKGPECARCAEDAARPRPTFRRDPAPTVSAGSGEAGAAPGMPRTAEPLVTAAAPPLTATAKKPGVVERVFVMFMILLLATAGGVLVGIVAGWVFLLAAGGDLTSVAGAFVIGCGIAGVVYGWLACRHYTTQVRAR